MTGQILVGLATDEDDIDDVCEQPEKEGGNEKREEEHDKRWDDPARGWISDGHDISDQPERLQSMVITVL
jgi:hypothetical protein